MLRACFSPNGSACAILAEIIRTNVMPPWEGLPFYHASPLATLDLLPPERREYWPGYFENGDGTATNYLTPPRDDAFTVPALGQAMLVVTLTNRAEHHAQTAVGKSRTEAGEIWMCVILQWRLWLNIPRCPG